MAQIIGDGTQGETLSIVSFVDSLNSGILSTELMTNGLTVKNMLAEDDFNVNYVSNIAGNRFSSQAAVPNVIYQMRLDYWNIIATWALTNADNVSGVISNAAQHLVQRFIPSFLTNYPAFADSRISGGGVITFPSKAAPNYRFVPLVSNIINTGIFNQTFVQGSTYCLTGKVAPIYGGLPMSLQLRNSEGTVVQTVTLTVASDGFVEGNWTVAAPLVDGIYSVGINTSFSLLNASSFTSGFLVGNVTIANIVGFDGFINTIITS